tara:strand:+ start:192 stop:416 length:225 start_codon:yes stop_codon:yes gene_type:complete
MIEKIVDRRAQLAQSHQQVLGEIQQVEMNLQSLRNSLQQIIGAVSILDNLHPPQAESDAPEQNGLIEPELEEVT